MKTDKTRYKAIAIDDEPLALDVIEKFCQRRGDIDLVSYSNPEEGLISILDTRPDIVFLDIEMENITGLSIAAQLPEGTSFIFTTAYINYALEGFNLDAVDYLHKPFSFQRFDMAIAKAVRRIEAGRSSDINGSIVVKQEYSNVNISLNSIIYIEAMEGYSKIFRENQGPVMTRVVLKNMATMLPEDRFIRIHRSFIVAKDKIIGFTRQEIKLVNGTTLPVGRQYSETVTTLLLKGL